MKRTITILLAALMIIGLLTPAALANTGFTDVPANAWYAPYVEFVNAEGVMTGTTATTFNPSGNFSRAQVTATVFRMMLGRPANAEDHSEVFFTDVGLNVWYNPYVHFAARHGIVTGLGDGRFAPHNNVTRQEFAVMLFRYSRQWVEGPTIASPQGPNWNNFTDRGQIASWATDELMWANYHGLITGRTATTIAPTGNVTRAEAATMLTRFIRLIAEITDTEPEPPQPQGVNIAPLHGRNFSQVRHYFGDDGRQPYPDILSQLWVFGDEYAFWCDEFDQTRTRYAVEVWVHGGRIWQIVINFYSDLLSPTAFQFNGVDGASARADVRATLGAPHDSYLDSDGIMNYYYLNLVSNTDLTITFNHSGYVGRLWFRDI